MKTVAIGMSGGVDSSTAAALLKKQGYKVIGFTMLLIDNFDYKDAKKVCDDLDIEFHLIDLRKQFNEKVKNTFLEDYKNGLTPNPCTLCNKYIKFGIMYEELLKLKADYIATGHYAKIKNGLLYKADDKNKDQSYFLYSLTKEKLNKILFPLEKYSKTEVRELAKEFNLITALKKESNDVCFINGTFKDYIKKNLKQKRGNIINRNTNEIIGTHDGLSLYTLGQRRGLNIGGTEKRMFVCGKDIEKNILYVTIGDENKYLFSKKALLTDVNLITTLPEKCSAKFRYRQDDNIVQTKLLNNGDVLVSYNSIKAVTPGQICVLYDNDLCIGGGTIKEVFND